MRYVLLSFACFLPLLAAAQFTPVDDGLTIIVTDGTDSARNSPLSPPGNGLFSDPIRPLGLMDAVQAGAFTERPTFGKAGFLLIFCVNDAVGGRQGTLTVNGIEYKGIYRLIRQKMSADEVVEAGMTPYHLAGTVFILGISQEE